MSSSLGPETGRRVCQEQRRYCSANGAATAIYRTRSTRVDQDISPRSTLFVPHHGVKTPGQARPSLTLNHVQLALLLALG